MSLIDKQSLSNNSISDTDMDVLSYDKFLSRAKVENHDDRLNLIFTPSPLNINTKGLNTFDYRNNAFQKDAPSNCEE